MRYLLKRAGRFRHGHVENGRRKDCKGAASKGYACEIKTERMLGVEGAGKREGEIAVGGKIDHVGHCHGLCGAKLAFLRLNLGTSRGGDVKQEPKAEGAQRAAPRASCSFRYRSPGVDLDLSDYWLSW